MPGGLKRYHDTDDAHFITFSCFQRSPLLGNASARDLFLEVLEKVRRRYSMKVYGYVVMPR